MEVLQDEEEIYTKNPNLLLMITNPVENFNRIRINPKWIVALIIIALITSITAVIIVKMTFSGEFLENELGILIQGDDAFADELASGLFYFSAGTAIITSFIMIPIVCLITALIYLLVGKISNSPTSFKQYFSLSVHVTIISALAGVVHLIYNALVSGAGPDFIFTSLQAIVHADGAMSILLTSINVFAIWQLIISAIGLQVVARIPKMTAWITVIAMFLVSTGLGVVGFIINEVSSSFL